MPIFATLPANMQQKKDAPSQSSLRDKAKAKALKHIQKCENGSNGYVLLNSEKHAWDYSPTEAPQLDACYSSLHEGPLGFNSCDHTFEKYVAYEAILEDMVIPVPPKNATKHNTDIRQPLVEEGQILRPRTPRSTRGMLFLLALAMCFGRFWDMPFLPAIFQNKNVQDFLFFLVVLAIPSKQSH